MASGRAVGHLRIVRVNLYILLVYMWWVDLGQLLDTLPASLFLLNRTGEENKVKELMI